MSSRRPTRTFRYGDFEGIVDRRLPDFTYRIVRSGFLTSVHANRVTLSAFQWMTIDLDPFRQHPEGTFTMEPKMVRAAYGEAKGIEDELHDIVARFLDPQPPKGPAALRVA